MPEEPLQPVGKLTRVSPNEVSGDLQPVGKLTPVGKVENKLPTEWGTADTKPNDQLENTLNDIVKTSKRSISDGEKDILRGMLSNPSLTPEQAKESIQAMQGYHPKQQDNTITTPDYYVKQDKNGVIRPVPLGYGERPPKGYDVAKVWGTQKEANDDSWYTDIGKSLANGAVGLVGGVIDLAQLGNMAITGEESKNLTAAKQSTEALKFAKDEDLNKPLFNTEGIDEWADLIDKKRYDLSPSALWGTMNMVAESAVGFLGGAGAAAKTAKGITGLAELGQGAKTASAFVGSYLTQVGEGLDAAREAGLEGRDAATFASVTTAAKAAIDAQFGILPNAWKNSFKASEKELLKKFASTITKDADGKITDASLKELGKTFSVEYAKMAAIGLKEVGKDALKEGVQEGSQDFIQKAAENLWDKMTPEDKAKFGTDAFSAKSFGSYIQNAAAGLIGGVPMAIASTNYKKKYNEQSVNALDLVEDTVTPEGGIKTAKDKQDEFKANLYQAARRGDISEEERDQAIFKVDAYNKYNEQIKDLKTMSREDKKEAFELSFNIEALKSEIPSKEDISQLDPIGQSKVKIKEKLIDGLQKDLNRILLKQDIQTETKVGEKTKKEVENDLTPREDERSLKSILNELGGFKKKNFEGKQDLGNPPRQELTKMSTVEANTMAEQDPMKFKAVVQEHLKKTPNNEQEVTIRSAKNGRLTADLGDNKQIWFAQSVKPTSDKADTYINYDNLPKTKVEVTDMGGATSGEGEKEYYFKEPAVIKRVEFESKDKAGNPIVKAVLPIYNKETGKFIGFAKESKLGKSQYPSKSDQDNLAKIRAANLHTGELKEFAYVPVEQRGIAPVVKNKSKERAVKPELKLNFIVDKSQLDKMVKTTVVNELTGEELETSVKFGKLQAQIIKKLNILQEVNTCVHGRRR